MTKIEFDHDTKVFKHIASLIFSFERKILSKIVMITQNGSSIHDLIGDIHKSITSKSKQCSLFTCSQRKESSCDLIVLQNWQNNFVLIILVKGR